MRFAFDNPDMDFAKAKVPYSDVIFEIIKTEKDAYSIFTLAGDTANEVATFTKEELKTLWKMLSEK